MAAVLPNSLTDVRFVMSLQARSGNVYLYIAIIYVPGLKPNASLALRRSAVGVPYGPGSVPMDVRRRAECGERRRSAATCRWTITSLVLVNVTDANSLRMNTHLT